MKIDHAALYVLDLERAKSFFETFFGAISNDGYHNEKTGFRSYFLTFEGEMRLEIMCRPGMQDLQKPEMRTGFSHIAFHAGSAEKVDALTSAIKGAGYTVLSGPRTTGDGYYESCILDFEGNQIEITV